MADKTAGQEKLVQQLRSKFETTPEVSLHLGVMRLCVIVAVGSSRPKSCFGFVERPYVQPEVVPRSIIRLSLEMNNGMCASAQLPTATGIGIQRSESVYRFLDNSLKEASTWMVLVLEGIRM